MDHIVVSRFTSAWMFLGIFIIATSKKSSPFFENGPNDNLSILGVSINTYPKYIGLLFYTVVNTCIRSAVHNIVSPWVLLNVQDKTKPWQKNSYEISTNLTIYIWFDWFVNMNVLLSQIDIAIIDLLTETAMCLIITQRFKIQRILVAECEATQSASNSQNVVVDCVQVRGRT
jgi:hypothetical protein